MDISLGLLDYTFKSKPLLVGGKAKEYYDVRKSGADIDLIVTVEDYTALAAKYPDNLKDLWGDLGVCVHGFEIWKTITLFDYAYLSEGAVDVGEYLVISLEKLLFLTAMAMKVPKYHDDLELIVKKVLEKQYMGFDDRKYKVNTNV